MLMMPRPTLLHRPSDAGESSRLAGYILMVHGADRSATRIPAALRAEGFWVTEVSSGTEALEVARTLRPDTVVLETCGDDDGALTLSRDLKLLTEGILPVLHLCSDTMSSQDRARRVAAGADGYLVSPFDDNEVRAAVRGLVRLKHEASEHAADHAISSVLRDTLDALADHVALLSPEGDVVAVNQAWMDFAAANGYASGGTGLGVNYCTVCEQATGEGAAESREAAWGIRDVLAGDERSFELAYPCHAPGEERWFRMVVRAVGRNGPVAAIVTHTNRTTQRLAARAEVEAGARADESRRAERA